jgi:hypothetical protein
MPNKKLVVQPLRGLDAFSAPQQKRYEGLFRETVMNKIATFLLLFATSHSAYSESDTFFHSGTIADAYIEEDLPEFLEKFREVLNTSNLVIELVQRGEYSTIHGSHFSENLQKKITKGALEKSFKSTLVQIGKITKFKPMQWYFRTGIDDDVEYLKSIKIVEHEYMTLSYELVFDKNNAPPKMIGIRVNEYISPNKNNQS